jgi:hypothetical protein
MGITAKCVAALTVTLLLSLSFCSLPPSLAADVTVSYQLVNQDDGTLTHTLNVVIPQTLIDYYKELSHRSAGADDFPKFVTPYALKPIADCLRQIYPDDEDFTNAVLTLVHQIPFQEVVKAYYPVETMLTNNGDCDLLSFIAASILDAGGLDVVLLLYTSEEHMNIAVHFAEKPTDARLTVYSVKENNVTYYVAECTSSNWKEGWQVGESPEDLKNASATIITLENSEQIAPGQVSASFKKLDPTVLGLEVSPSFTVEGSLITLKGHVTPAVPNENVTVYWSADGSPWLVLTTIMTGSNGEFVYSWTPDATGLLATVDVRASWTGNQQYAGTTSQAANAVLISYIILAVIIAAIIVVIVASIVAVEAQRRHRKEPALSSNSTNVNPTPEQSN